MADNNDDGGILATLAAVFSGALQALFGFVARTSPPHLVHPVIRRVESRLAGFWPESSGAATPTRLFAPGALRIFLIGADAKTGNLGKWSMLGLAVDPLQSAWSADAATIGKMAVHVVADRSAATNTFTGGSDLTVPASAGEAVWRLNPLDGGGAEPADEVAGTAAAYADLMTAAVPDFQAAAQGGARTDLAAEARAWFAAVARGWLVAVLALVRLQAAADGRLHAVTSADDDRWTDPVLVADDLAATSPGAVAIWTEWSGAGSIAVIDADRWLRLSIGPADGREGTTTDLSEIAGAPAGGDRCGGPRMRATAFPFRGANFFAEVRTRMQADRGMFFGSDGPYRYVCVDPVFYRLSVFRRPDSEKFTTSVVAAARANPNLRVATNGQFFSDYHFWDPGPTRWEGQTLVSGTVIDGSDGISRPHLRYFGQARGAPVQLLRFGLGEPATVQPPLDVAFGGLWPLVLDGRPATAAQLGKHLIDRSAGTGKCVYGLHLTQEVLFALVQEDGAGGGDKVEAVRDRLVAMGVDQALLADGSNSAALMVDGVIEAEPGGYKDKSIPSGPALILTPLRLLASSTLTLGTSTDPLFAGPLTLHGTEGFLELTSPGSALQFTALGTPTVGTAAELLQDLGVTLPLRLTTTQAPLPPLEPMLLTGPSVQARLEFVRSDALSVSGTFVVTTSRGWISFDAQCQIDQ